MNVCDLGVFGNSPSSSIHPTWAIFADNLTDTSTAGVITDSTLLPTLEDFKYTTATDNSWHMSVLTYNGKNSPLPTLQYYVDGEEMIGNSRLESGKSIFLTNLFFFLFISFYVLKISLILFYKAKCNYICLN